MCIRMDLESVLVQFCPLQSLKTEKKKHIEESKFNLLHIVLQKILSLEQLTKQYFTFCLSVGHYRKTSLYK